MFSKACQYGIRATVCVAMQSKEGGWVSVGDIAERTDSPQAFTAKILQILTKNGILDSLKGPHGGYRLEMEKSKKVNLSQIVYAIDGDRLATQCSLGFSNCSEQHPCLVHHRYMKVRKQTVDLLERTSVSSLVQDTLKKTIHLA